MKKLQGFTLIELMVVMAIIAILATAGLSAYTGYIKKARDTKRISDLSAINTIVLANMAVDGRPPQTALEAYEAVKAANNGRPLVDPLADSTGVTTKSTCLDATGSDTLQECSYTYRVSDGGLGFAVGTRFESPSNIALYTSDGIGAAGTHADSTLFEVGSSSTPCIGNGNPVGCPATATNPTKLDTISTTVISISHAPIPDGTVNSGDFCLEYLDCIVASQCIDNVCRQNE